MKFIIGLLIVGLWSCQGNDEQSKPKEAKDQSLQVINYLALGDSYTIGEGVEEEKRFPIQLYKTLEGIDREKSRVKIVAATGWTTGDLLAAMAREELDRMNYDFITLLIGVNNQYQGKPIDEYKEELKILIEQSLALLDGDNERLIMVSIPDYGVTPFAQSRDPEIIAREIAMYNTIMEDYAKEYDTEYIYITDLTKKAKDDITLLASDQLHPSGTLYAQWVERIEPIVHKILNRK